MRLFKSDNTFDLEPFFLSSLDYLCIAGYDGYFRKVNPAFIKLIGYELEELLASPINRLVHPDDRLITAKTRTNILEGFPLLNFQNRYITKSGEIIWLTWTSIPVPDKKLIYAIAKNITHIKEHEKERQVLIKDLVLKNTGLKQFTYMTAHDLRTPVSNLISLFGLLDLSNVHDEETLLHLELLEKSVHELKSTLNDQVDHLKSNALLKYNLEPVDLRKVFHDTTVSIRSLIENSGATFEVDFSDVKMLLGNTFYLKSIFLNLITNSIKYAQPGIPPKITIISQKKGNRPQIRFSDSGVGVDLEKNGDKIFGLNQVFTNNADSKGIGLFLVKNHMDNLGGIIEVTSQVNMGTTFTLTFES